MTDLSSFEFAASVFVDRPPAEVYDLVSDVTRTGEWSPVCTGCEWDDGAGPVVGAQFTGTNETPVRTWTTRSTVVAADPGREFAWEVGKGYVRWGYVLAPDHRGTTLTESWQFLEAGREFFTEKYGDQVDAEIEARVYAAHEGIPATLARIKQIAEQQPR